MGKTYSTRFNGNWNLAQRLITVFRMSVWIGRGFFRKWRLRKSTLKTFIGPSVKIYYPSGLEIGANFVAERGCEINCLSTQGMKFGNNVTVGSYALIRPSNLYGGSIGAGLKVGDNSNIGPYSYIGCSGYIEIGENVMISPRVSLYAENHNFQEVDRTMKDQGVDIQSLVIEDDCWIAANSVILAGVKVGQGSVIAAGSVVTKNVAPYSVVAGNPAKLIRKRG